MQAVYHWSDRAAIAKALENEQVLFAELMNSKSALVEMQRFIANGGQTKGEMRVSGNTIQDCNVSLVSIYHHFYKKG